MLRKMFYSSGTKFLFAKRKYHFICFNINKFCFIVTVYVIKHLDINVLYINKVHGIIFQQDVIIFIRDKLRCSVHTALVFLHPSLMNIHYRYGSAINYKFFV